MGKKIFTTLPCKALKVDNFLPLTNCLPFCIIGATTSASGQGFVLKNLSVSLLNLQRLKCYKDFNICLPKKSAIYKMHVISRYGGMTLHPLDQLLRTLV